MKHSGHLYHRFLQAEDRMLERITRSQERDRALIEQAGFLYQSYERDNVLGSEVESHQVGEGHWQY